MRAHEPDALFLLQIVREGPRDTVLKTKSGEDVPASRRHFAKLKERFGP